MMQPACRACDIVAHGKVLQHLRGAQMHGMVVEQNLVVAAAPHQKKVFCQIHAVHKGGVISQIKYAAAFQLLRVKIRGFLPADPRFAGYKHALAVKHFCQQLASAVFTARYTDALPCPQQKIYIRQGAVSCAFHMPMA